MAALLAGCAELREAAQTALAEVTLAPTTPTPLPPVTPTDPTPLPEPALLPSPSATPEPTLPPTPTPLPTATPTLALFAGPARDLLAAHAREFTPPPRVVQATPVRGDPVGTLPTLSYPGSPAPTPTSITPVLPRTLAPDAVPGTPGVGTALGTVQANHWRFELGSVASDPGRDETRRLALLFARVTNEGRVMDSFSAYSLIILEGGDRETYNEDAAGSSAARAKYGTESPADIVPGGSRQVVVAYDIPADVRSFRLRAGSLAVTWQGEVSFVLP